MGIIGSFLGGLLGDIQRAHRNSEIIPNPVMEVLNALAWDAVAEDLENRQNAEQETRAVKEARRAAEENVRRVEQERVLAERARRKAEDSARRNAEARRCAEEQARQAKLEQEKALAEKAVAEKAAAEAVAAAEETKKAFKGDIKPVITPTLEELEATKKRLGYKTGYFHFAVAGTSGSGKSSLINAFRGLRNGSNDPSVGKTGVTETTSTITRYRDPNEAIPFAWYDIPGAGTLSVPDAEYFNVHGLYIFDCIIVLMDIRFTATDEAILRNCARFQIPSYLVRSKSLQHVENVMRDMLGDDEEEKDDKACMDEAVEKYVTETRASVADNLAKAELPDQRVYMVDIDNIFKIVKRRKPKRAIDEYQLMDDLLSTARYRRIKPKRSPQSLLFSSAASALARSCGVP